MELTNRKTLRELLSKHNLSAKKSLGQNFLVNPGVCEKIAEASGARKGVGALEIGPGIGSLTSVLAERAEKVVSIEIDSRLFPVLEETLQGKPATIIQGDALKVDLAKILKDNFGDMPAIFCANLPYYITSPIIMKLLEQHLPLESITVMVQKEAAVRLCALPGTKDAGAISYAVRYFAEPKLLFTVSPGSFWPQPNVESAVVHFAPKPKEELLPPQDEKRFFFLIKLAFSQRRKMLSGILAKGLTMERTVVEAALKKIGASPQARAQELTLEQFFGLQKELSPFLLNIEKRGN